MNPSTAFSFGKQSPFRPYLVFIAALLLAALTARLGVWQLARADEKRLLLQAAQLQAALPTLTVQDVSNAPQLWRQVHRTVLLQGHWLSEKTVYLDNRTHRGQSGFWVMTPLRWASGQVVWVQRGWVARDPVDAGKAAPVQTPGETVSITARISPGLSHMVELKKTDIQTVDGAALKIQANLDLSEMKAMVSDTVSAVVVQTDADSDGLRRDWVLVGVDPEKNTAYAVQWFCLSGLVTLLYVWFQWIGPLFHARQR